MIRLLNEHDPKRINPKHMSNKQILVRDKDDIFIAKVVVINDISYVYRWGISRELSEFDGWSNMPIQEIDEEMRKRELDMFFSAD